MDERINKWKIFGYVILTWFVLAIIADIGIELDTKSSIDLITAHALLWAWLFLILGIYRTYKNRKQIKARGLCESMELAYGIGGFFFIPVIVAMLDGWGILLTMVFFGYTNYKWEKTKLEIK